LFSASLSASDLSPLSLSLSFSHLSLPFSGNELASPAEQVQELSPQGKRRADSGTTSCDPDTSIRNTPNNTLIILITLQTLLTRTTRINFLTLLTLPLETRRLSSKAVMMTLSSPTSFVWWPSSLHSYLKVVGTRRQAQIRPLVSLA
jgi:hypothetical protein